MKGIILDLGRYWIMFMFEALKKAEKDVSLEETCFFSHVWYGREGTFFAFCGPYVLERDSTLWRVHSGNIPLFSGVSFSRGAKRREKKYNKNEGGWVGRDPFDQHKKKYRGWVGG